MHLFAYLELHKQSYFYLQVHFSLALADPAELKQDVSNHFFYQKRKSLLPE